MLDKEILHSIFLIFIVCLATSSFILFRNQSISSISLLDPKRAHTYISGFVSKVNTKMEITFHHTPMLSIPFISGSTKGVELKLFGLRVPEFKYFSKEEEYKFKKRLLRKLEEDFLQLEIGVQIRKRDFDLKLLSVCRSSTLLARNLAIEYLLDGFCSLDYNLEKDDMDLFSEYKKAEAYARKRKLGLWKFELKESAEDVTKNQDYKKSQNVNDEINF